MTIITDEKAREVCKLATEKVCRYLGLSSHGFECLKGTHFQPLIDERVKNKQMLATEINCQDV